MLGGMVHTVFSKKETAMDFDEKIVWVTSLSFRNHFFPLFFFGQWLERGYFSILRSFSLFFGQWGVFRILNRDFRFAAISRQSRGKGV
jgi:hypothetical protein